MTLKIVKGHIEAQRHRLQQHLPLRLTFPALVSCPAAPCHRLGASASALLSVGVNRRTSVASPTPPGPSLPAPLTAPTPCQRRTHEGTAPRINNVNVQLFAAPSYVSSRTDFLVTPHLHECSDPPPGALKQI